MWRAGPAHSPAVGSRRIRGPTRSRPWSRCRSSAPTSCSPTVRDVLESGDVGLRPLRQLYAQADKVVQRGSRSEWAVFVHEAWLIAEPLFSASISVDGA